MKRPLRFCMLTTFYPPYNFGGDGIFVHRLANALAQSGHHVEVIHCRDAYRLLARQEPSAAYADHPNVTVHGLESPLGSLAPLAAHQTGFPLLQSMRVRQILEAGFDVIHYHNISLLGPKVLEYGRGLKLYTMHEYWLICPTHVLFRFNTAACVRPHCLTCSLTYKRPPQWWRYGRLLQAAVQHVRTFIAPSRFCQQIHQQRGLPLPMVHIPHFVPETPLAPAPRPSDPSPSPAYFLFVGRLEKLKGLQTLIPLFQRYAKAQLWIAGTGTYESELKQLAAGHKNIRFLGHVSAGPLQALYRQAVAVLVPSLCFEIFALVILEAFQQHTPVIVRNQGGMPETVTESGGGFVYNAEQELVSAMDALMAEPALRRVLGLRGYQAYQRHWTTEAHLKRYFAIIQAATQTDTPSRADMQRSLHCSTDRETDI